MEAFARDYLDVLQTWHHALEVAVDGLPLEALDWVPGPNMNSLAVLVMHVAGSERYWLSDVIAGTSSQRDRDAEFRASGQSAEDLRSRLAEATAFAREVVAPLTHDDFEATRISPRDGKEVTIGWALINTLAHTAAHAGHASLTRQLWEQNQAS